ncbi:unnamed protein product [Mytilus edulis]|uniref:Uncharacterized protein n=1 Tax=Mytilus edulis TaxID=6550 RepID=A0A8S3SEU6_MYTED|nr:unnamed protein product [Mytilus edulis]
MRFKHSGFITNKFVEKDENICRKKLIEMETEIESDSEFTDSSEDENSLTSSEEGEYLEKTNDMVDTDYESVEEPVENKSSYIKYILAQNVNNSSDDENPASELDLKGVNTNQMNNSNGQYFNVMNCDVSCPVRLEWEKSRRHNASFTRKIPNLEDTLSTSKRLIHLQHMKSASLNSDNIVEKDENICRKKLIEMETEIESDSEFTDSSEDENSLTSSEEGEYLEKTNDMVDTDYESVEEPVENKSSYIKYILAQNVNNSSDDENPASELDLKGLNTNQMNNSNGQYFNVMNCDVSCPVRLEWEKSRRHNDSFTRKIPNLEDTLSTSKRLIHLQHMKSASLNSDNIVYTQRPSFNSNDEDKGNEYLRDEHHHEKTQVHTKKIVQQIQWVGSDRKNEEILDYGKNKAIISQNGVQDGDELVGAITEHEQIQWVGSDRENEEILDYGKNKAIISQNGVQDGDELVGAITEHELAVADEVYSPGLPVWKEAINILKDTFMKKKKRTRKKGMFAPTNTVTFTKWLPDNFPVEGVMCGCGRHFKTPTSLLGHLRRKSATARKSLKLFKK